MTLILGLTGSIGMGKSTTAAMFRDLGCPVHDADATVHDLYAGDAVEPIRAAFPGAVRDGVVDRSALGAAVVGHPDRLAALEAIVHPLVRAREEAFVALARSSGAPVAVLDIPLLFETGGETRCDKVLVVSAPPDVQRARVMARPGMTEERFAALLGRQWPDADKRARADYVVDTSEGLEPTRRRISAIVRELSGEKDITP